MTHWFKRFIAETENVETDMLDELVHTEQEKIERGLEAAALLAHPLLVAAFRNLRIDYLKKIEESPARDSEGREYLHKKLRVLWRVKDDLERVVREGQEAQAVVTMNENVERFSG